MNTTLESILEMEEESQDEEGVQALRMLAANGASLQTTIEREPEI